MNFSRLYTCFLLFLLSVPQTGAQITLRIISGDREVSRLNYTEKHSSRQEAFKEINNVLLALQYKGYLLASADTMYHDSISVTARISQNELYRIARLGIGNLNPNVASKLGISEKLYLNKPLRFREVARSFEKILEYYENNGYPFVTVTIDSLIIQQEELFGQLNVNKNNFFKVDSIRIVGNARVSSNFLFRYLGVRQGMPYNEALIAGISRKIRQLPFVVESKPLEARLSDQTNRLILFLDKKDASQFDGIIGLLPDATTRKTVVTGDVKLKLVNGIFRSGETFDLEWRRLQSQTQDFSGRVIYPYLFGTPVGADYALKIYRRDTTFVDINNNFGLQYYFSGLNNFKVFYRQRNSNLISTSGLDYVTSLPDYADIATKSYGVALFLEKLNYRFNPHKGIATLLSLQTGNRSIKPNRKVNPVVYEDLLLRSLQFQAEGSFDTYIRLSGNNVLKLGLQGATIFGNSTIFRNELFRIGGLKTLRGFDEESIFASTYIIPTIEYRFLFSENSHILLFAEGAFYENNSNRQYMNDTPTSVGAGMTFDTKAGILSMHYALGNQFGNGFDLRSGKIHFGLTALF